MLRRLLRDFVWKILGSPVAVIDAKYESEKPVGYPNADPYQLLAYCTVIGLRSGHLVYAKGNEEPGRHRVRHSGIEIYCHAIDLSQEPGILLAQMSELGDHVGRQAADAGIILRAEHPGASRDLDR